MKLAKLSLAAMVVAGLASSSFAADTLADAFKQGKVSGELKAYYFDRDDGVNSEGIFTTGLLLNYKTASFYGFGLNFTGQASASPFANSDEKAMFAGDEYGSGAVLSEAYLSYSAGKTTALVGRMFLDTPLVASSGSRMTKEAFEGAAIINTDLPNTTLIAGYVQRAQARTNGLGDIGEFSKNRVPTAVANIAMDDGAYTLAAINKSITGLTLTAAFADVIDVAQVIYAEAAYEGKANSFTYGLAAQYYSTDFDSALAPTTDLFGVKASLGYGPLSGYIAYSKVSDDAFVVPGLGNSADLIYTASQILSTNYGGDTEAYKVGLDYAITEQAKVGVSYVNLDDNGHGFGFGEVNYYGVAASYEFAGALKGFSLGAEFDYGDHKDANFEDQEVRVKAAYKF